MKTPETYEKLLELVNPEDLLEVLDFCGKNDYRDKTHSKIREQFSHNIYFSIKDRDIRHPTNQFMELTKEHYDTIVKCVQDFYWWSRKFQHNHTHIFKRVVNALEIPMEEIEKIFEVK